MSLALVVFWGIAGWCGTPPPPPPWPIPFPRWFTSRILGVAGGIAGGWLFNTAWPIEAMQNGMGLAVAATGVGAWFGSRFVKDIVAPMFSGPEPLPPD